MSLGRHAQEKKRTAARTQLGTNVGGEREKYNVRSMASHIREGEAAHVSTRVAEFLYKIRGWQEGFCD